jgi:predicted aspartyl protease
MVSRTFGIAAATMLLLCAVPAAADPPTGCGVFIARQDGPRIVLERLEVPSGETRVIQSDPESGVIGVVFPPGPGVSGSVEQPREGRLIVIRCSGTRLHCEVRSGGRVASGFPDRDAADLARFDTRVSVIGGDGSRAAFLIEEYARAVVDSGPLQNLFAGAPIPLGSDDFIVTTDTSEHVTGEPAAGEAQVEVRGHVFIHVIGPDGRAGWFLLDTGAAETVVSRAFLPDTARIAEAAMVEYSAAGRRLLDYSPGGATGPVEGVLGHSVLSELRAGTITFRHVEAAILPEIPDYFDRPVSGIIGIDLLRRAEAISIEWPSGAAGQGRLRLLETGETAATGAKAPLFMVSSHVMVPAEVNGTRVFMIIDSGAPRPMLDSTAAIAAGMSASTGRTLRGLGGRAVSSARANIGSLGLGGRNLADVPCDVSPLDVFRPLRRGDQQVGLMGNSLLSRFERVVIDFRRRSVTFAGPRSSP